MHLLIHFNGNVTAVMSLGMFLLLCGCMSIRFMNLMYLIWDYIIKNDDDKIHNLSNVFWPKRLSRFQKFGLNLYSGSVLHVLPTVIQKKRKKVISVKAFFFSSQLIWNHMVAVEFTDIFVNWHQFPTPRW